MANWGSIADWFSGFGSLSASLVALHIARRSVRIKLKGYCGIRVVIGAGEVQLLSITVTNVCTRPVTITNLGIRIRNEEPREACILATRDTYSVGVPHQLNDGDSAQFGIQIGPNDRWFRDLIRTMRLKEYDLAYIRFVVITSHGYELVLVPEANVTEKLKELIKEPVG